jgi:hypothetical protein
LCLSTERYDGDNPKQRLNDIAERLTLIQEFIDICENGVTNQPFAAATATANYVPIALGPSATEETLLSLQTALP